MQSISHIVYFLHKKGKIPGVHAYGWESGKHIVYYADCCGSSTAVSSKNEKRLYRDTLIISGAKIRVGICSPSQHNAHVYSSKNTSSEQKTKKKKKI